MILANTEELHEKIERLCTRIKDLESALQVLQASVSTQPHPLLREDLLQLKVPFSDVEHSRVAEPAPSLSEDEKVPLDSFGKSKTDCRRNCHLTKSLGTLSLGLFGETNFIGDTGRADVRQPIDGYFCQTHKDVS